MTLSTIRHGRHRRIARDLRFTTRSVSYLWAACSLWREKAGLPALIPARLPYELGDRARHHEPTHSLTGRAAATQIFPRVGTLPVLCGHCPGEPHPVSVSVYGWPDPALTDPLTVARCCSCCVPELIARARSQQAEGDDRDIRVELMEVDD